MSKNFKFGLETLLEIRIEKEEESKRQFTKTQREQKETEMALQYGRLKKTEWRYGKVIEGAVTKELAEFLLSLPKPSDTEVYNKMTPFFSIFLDNGFSSEHYGTELNGVKENE